MAATDTRGETPLVDIPLDPLTYRFLKRKGIETAQQLWSMSEQELRAIGCEDDELEAIRLSRPTSSPSPPD